MTKVGNKRFVQQRANCPVFTVSVTTKLQNLLTVIYCHTTYTHTHTHTHTHMHEHTPLKTQDNTWTPTLNKLIYDLFTIVFDISLEWIWLNITSYSHFWANYNFMKILGCNVSLLYEYLSVCLLDTSINEVLNIQNMTSKLQRECHVGKERNMNKYHRKV